jgi:hypothetical protein
MNNRTKPFEKYLGKEDVMQAEVCRVLGLKYPNLFWWHTPNEGKRTPFEQYKFKEIGGGSGIADLTILEESNFSKGLMIELKWGKNACSKAQVDFLIRSAKKGYTAAVVYDYAADVLELIDRHLGSGIGIPGDGIILIKGGKQTVVLLDEAHAVLIKKSTVKPDVQKAKKLFQAKAKERFGSVPSGMKALFKKVADKG